MQDIDIQDLARLAAPGLDRRLLSVLLQQMPSGVLVAEAPSGRILFANPQMHEVWRRPVLPELEEWSGFHSDGRAYTLEEWPLARALRDGEVVRDEEIEILRGDGTRASVRFSAEPVTDEDERVVAVVLTALDITEQRRRTVSRRFLADAGTILSSSLDYVSTLRNLARLAVGVLADWCIVDLLDEVGELDRVAIEHRDPKRSSGVTQLARRHPPTLETEVGIERVLRTSRSELIPHVNQANLARFTRSEGQRRFLAELGVVSAMIVPIVARNSPLGVIIFVTAESGRRYGLDDLEVAEELATRAALAIENSRLFDQSRAATEAKSNFLAVMSHELRTPLTAIIGYSELLQLGVPDAVTPRQHEQAERIEMSARHLLQLIEEILTLVTLESGERRVEREELNVNELLRRAAGIIEPLAKAKGLQMRIVSAADDPVIRSDADKLLQILLNLLSNAVKFTEKGGIRLTATHRAEFLVFEVEDTGIGLDVEHLARIFEPFWQVERPITRRAGGTGLGLTISRRLADLLGASLEVESAAGMGSTFRVLFPI
jgi:signal transduction histidine kinase